MSGPGVIIKLYDAQNGYTATDIIHDSDVRDVVNELLAAGAKGVAVGGQRLIATSPIRCVGPVIRVNQKEISANPVLIEAVGDPDVLASGLDIIRFSLEFHRKFQFEIEKRDNVILPQYRSYATKGTVFPVACATKGTKILPVAWNMVGDVSLPHKICFF